jgi:flavin-binding protein dodecin
MATVFEYIEVVGTSQTSIEDAVRAALDSVRAQRTVAWFEIVSTRGRLLDASDAVEYQVAVRFGCKR